MQINLETIKSSLKLHVYFKIAIRHMLGSGHFFNLTIIYQLHFEIASKSVGRSIGHVSLASHLSSW